MIGAKYLVEAELGSGAMGVVYRAKQLDLGRDVAIKLLHAGAAINGEARLRFIREAKVATRLVHPAAVQVLDFGETDGQPYLVMELLEGGTLRERLKNGALTLTETLRVCREVASALAAAHDVRLIHRDIKPENIFLQRPSTPKSTDWRVRVVNFGLAFVAESDDLSVGRLTQDGVVGGTPAYMSPEQVHGRGIGPASDVYGLGCVLFELLANRPVFEGSLGDILTRQAYAPPPDLMRVAPTCAAPTTVVALLSKMLAKTAPLRPSPAQIVRVLDEVLRQPASDTTPRGTALPPRAERGFDPVPRPTSAEPNHGAVVYFYGAMNDSLELSLISAGANVELWPTAGLSAIPRTNSIIWAPGVDQATLQQLCASGIPTLTDLESATMDGIIAKLRAGAADVMVAPFASDQITRRLLRFRSTKVRP
ncbi:MAG: serine/threonine protein kinase [Kofleriaceae bacterium]|nr:serine/threonine protein kinase [Kofleriaceae bacterium]